MADFALAAPHPQQPNLLIGIYLDAFDHSTAIDHAFHLTHSFRIPGLFFPAHPGSTTNTFGDYLITYTYCNCTRLAAITANSRVHAECLMQHLQSEGKIVTPDQPIA